MVAAAIDELGVQDRTILISPVGCSVFAYYYFDVGNVQAAHGRAPAVATAVKRSHPNSIVVSYQGDGDLSAIGSAEILHAANRGENITVIFVNNGIYSMTGGQVAPTTLMGTISTTTPRGRAAANEGYPLHVSELLATLEAPVYIERVGLGDNRQIVQAGRAVRRALENQVKGLGFSLVEILAPCPTIWKMSPVDAQRWVRDVMEKTFPLGVCCDRTKKAEPRPEREPAPALEKIPRMLGVTHGDLMPAATPSHVTPPPAVDLQVRVAGFGGQGVLLLGEVLAEAGLDAGLEVSWLPSYGPEMRSGTSNCHVRLARTPIDSPLVTHPDVLVAMNEPSLHKFSQASRPGGWILYNGDELACGVRARRRAHPRALLHARGRRAWAIRAPATWSRSALCSPLPAALPQASVDTALGRLVKSPRWLDLDERAITRGRELLHEWLEEESHAV